LRSQGEGLPNNRACVTLSLRTVRKPIFCRDGEGKSWLKTRERFRRGTNGGPGNTFFRRTPQSSLGGEGQDVGSYPIGTGSRRGWGGTESYIFYPRKSRGKEKKERGRRRVKCLAVAATEILCRVRMIWEKRVSVKSGWKPQAWRSLTSSQSDEGKGNVRSRTPRGRGRRVIL